MKQQKQQILSRENVSIKGEADYIIKKAQDYDSRVVRLGELIFFSTQTGDAWMLDPSDKLALCLARDGERQRFTITETPTNFKIAWEARFSINGEMFIVVAQSGNIRQIMGYPIKEIKRLATNI